MLVTATASTAAAAETAATTIKATITVAAATTVVRIRIDGVVDFVSQHGYLLKIEHEMCSGYWPNSSNMNTAASTNVCL